MCHPTRRSNAAVRPGPVVGIRPGRQLPPLRGDPGSDNSQRQDHPVTHVPHRARKDAAWIGKALPTDADWEYPARRRLDGSTFAWGNQERPGGDPMANHWQGDFCWRNTGARGWRGTSPVGLFPANGYRLYDMTGKRVVLLQFSPAAVIAPRSSGWWESAEC